MVSSLKSLFRPPVERLISFQAGPSRIDSHLCTGVTPPLPSLTRNVTFLVFICISELFCIGTVVYGKLGGVAVESSSHFLSWLLLWTAAYHRDGGSRGHAQLCWCFTWPRSDSSMLMPTIWDLLGIPHVSISTLGSHPCKGLHLKLQERQH